MSNAERLPVWRADAEWPDDVLVVRATDYDALATENAQLRADNERLAKARDRANQHANALALETTQIRAELDAIKAQRVEAEFYVDHAILRRALGMYGISAPESDHELGARMESYAKKVIKAVAKLPFPIPPATDALVEALEECTTYLGLSQFNQIASGSKLHQLMGAALETYRASQRKEG